MRWNSDQDDWRRAAARRLVVPLAIMTAGVIVIAVGSGDARIIGWGVLAVGITVAISLLFLEVGLSEDRAREREQRQRRPPRRVGIHRPRRR